MAILPRSTCVDMPLWHRQTWLEKTMYFIREGDEIRVEILNSVSGRPFAIGKMTVTEFQRLSDEMLKPPGD